MRAFLLISFLAAVPVVSAQNLLQRTVVNDTMPNLVPNPGFERCERDYCAWTQEARKFNENVADWRSPTETTPDLFSIALDPSCWAHPGKRTNGRAQPHAGERMVGLKTWGKGNTPTFWHEYIQVELPDTL